MNALRRFFQAWWSARAERIAKRRFEATTPDPVAICQNCRQPFAMFDDDIILTFDDVELCRPCADRIEAIAVAS